MTAGRLLRLGQKLESPAALGMAVVLLVLALGATTTLASYLSLRSVGENAARRALHAESLRLRGNLSSAFGVADPLLRELGARVATLPADADRGALLTPMGRLATARAGLAWLSASFADGGFVGVYRGDDGDLRGLESTVGHPGVEKRYTLPTAASPELRETGPTDYDPRVRPFYRSAEGSVTALWTSPYAFLPNLNTGVSRVLPVRDSRGALVAVLTADFDTSGLASLLESNEGRTWVVAGDGSILAAQGVALPRARGHDAANAVHVRDLRDPVVAEATRALGSKSRARIVVDREALRVDRIGVMRLGALDIALVRAVPERVLFAPAMREAFRGMLGTAFIAALGVLLATALSRDIARLRRKRAEAELRAGEATARATELGSYRLLARIGAGGMGEVYRARHVLLARDAALKLIRHARDDDESDEREARFLEEARTVGSLRSAHTVSVYDFGITDDGRCYLAMELLEGLDLDALVRRFGPQPAARVAAILSQVCESLAEAHEKGLVHQDVKPANIFLCTLAHERDVVKVLDFGLTRAFSKTRNATGSVEGTPAFMSPEQASGDVVGPSADVYALGCVGYFLLAAQYPYARSTPREVMLAHLHDPVPRLPEAVLASIPTALATVVTRCLAKNPAMRPLSAAELAVIFRRIADQSSHTFPEEQRARFWDALGLECEAVRARDVGAATLPNVSVAGRTRTTIDP